MESKQERLIQKMQRYRRTETAGDQIGGVNPAELGKEWQTQSQGEALQVRRKVTASGRVRARERTRALIAPALFLAMVAGLTFMRVAVMLTWARAIDRKRRIDPGAESMRMVPTAPAQQVHGHR